ncbi:MAG: ATP-dependent DNA helicase DinG [Ectobacillus sp.]
MKNRYVVVDLETTGNAAKGGVDKITQIAAVVIEGGEIHEIFATFVNPRKSIPPFIAELTGINDDMVKYAPDFSHIAPMIIELLENSYFVAHNVQFDLNFLQEELRAAGYSPLRCSTIDTVELARFLYPTADSYKLGDLAKYFQLEHDNPHRADSDAMVTAELFLKLCEKLKQLPLVTLESLHKLSRSFKSDIGDLLSFYILEKMGKSELDFTYDIYRGIALRKRTYAVQLETGERPSFLDFTAEMEQRLREEMPGYENRQEQKIMMKHVHTAFTEARFLLAEAGTGTGKTLAYLLPSIFVAKEKNCPVIISTQTIQLQQQILEKEIPLLQKVIPFPFEVALIKGRKHYLCLHKFEHVLYEEDTNYDSVLTKAKILVWLLETETGDVDELNLPSGGRLLWERIGSDATSPAGKKNLWSSRCFYQRAKHRVYFADLIITNHALLFQDMMNEDPLLSDYEYVVLDEGHHIEEVASQTLGAQFSCLHFQMLLSRFGTLETQDVLAKLYETMQDYHCASVRSFKEMNKLLKELKFESDELFRMLRSFLFEKNKHKQLNNNIRLTCRYDVQTEGGKLWRAIAELTDRLNHIMLKLQQLMEEQLQIAKRHMNGLIIEEEFASLVQSLAASRDTLVQLLLNGQADGVTWMEGEAKGTLHSTVLYKQPIDVSDMLADHLFAGKKSVVLTSATLTVGGAFDYMIQSLGLNHFQPDTCIIPSPFQYERQVKMMIPVDLPNIKHVCQEEYVVAIAEHIIKIAKVTNGRMLVLFTSYEMLRQTYTFIKEREQLQEFALLAQSVNSGSRARMTKNFQQFEKAILFGTNSFWEGIDIPGEALSVLVMVRLPFSPPDHPITAAKMAKLKQTGKNAFMEMALPQAVIRFKQGFGRLIRTTADKGSFFILDRRITTTFYGKRFIDSIPSIPLYEEPLEELLNKIRT